MSNRVGRHLTQGGWGQEKSATIFCGYHKYVTWIAPCNRFSTLVRVQSAFKPLVTELNSIGNGDPARRKSKEGHVLCLEEVLRNMVVLVDLPEMILRSLLDAISSLGVSHSHRISTYCLLGYYDWSQVKFQVDIPLRLSIHQPAPAAAADLSHLNISCLVFPVPTIQLKFESHILDSILN